MSLLFLSVSRRTPPGKCKYKPVPVKTKSKRVQFRPLASESVLVFDSGLVSDTVPSAHTAIRWVGGLTFLPMACPMIEGCNLWLLYASPLHTRGSGANTFSCGLLSSIHSFTCSLMNSFIHSFSTPFVAGTVLIPGGTAVTLSVGVQSGKEGERVVQANK